MTVLKYKDFQGTVTFEDGHLLIQLLHIDDFITCECDSASDVQKCFEELVDEYIATCAEIGKEPCKPYKGSFNVRVPPELHRAIAFASVDQGLSLNAWIERSLRDTVDRSVSVANALKTVVERLDHRVSELQVTSAELPYFVWTRSGLTLNEIDSTDRYRIEAARLFDRRH